MIMVYDRALEYVRRIEHSGMSEFKGVSTDSCGILCVTDSSNDCIQVFNNAGVFLCSFGCDGSGVKRLNHPCLLCVFHLYMYVTDNFGDRVSVFTTVGEYVTSFGQLLSFW